MTASIASPRYSAEDFETRSVRSAAPSYMSEAPSYHSTVQHSEAIPPYTPPVRSPNNQHARATPATSQQQTIGLPPVPPAPPAGVPNLHNFRIPTWSTRNAPAARQLHSVVERRVNAAAAESSATLPVIRLRDQAQEQGSRSVVRPLEDPYLVGEEAAAEARQERLSREHGEDVLLREDKHWDWLLAQMKAWEEREKNWASFRRDADLSQRQRLLRSIGGRLV